MVVHVTELAWPLVALVAIAAAYRFGSRYLPAQDLARRIEGLEATKSELDAALEFNRGIVEKVAGIADRVGVLEMERGIGAQ